MYSFVVAIDKNNGMGLDNDIPWHLPADIKFFKDTTWNHTIIMGRKTFESLPKVLPNRYHIILTTNKDYEVNHDRAAIVHSVEELLSLTSNDEEYFVIGGSQIFDLLLPYTDRIYLTRIDEEFKADTYFHEPNLEEWTVLEEREGIVDEKNLFPHRYITLERKEKVQR